MTAPRHVAVIDIGKTNAKLALVDLESLTELAVATRPNAVLAAPPWPHFDTEGHWAFLLDGLRQFHRDHRIDAISITTHGACFALLDAAGKLAAPILDYEHPIPDDIAAAYDALRPPFAQTGSPRLAHGLNAGAQLHWLFSAHPGLLERTAHIVGYPQYWAHRLTGVAANDVTSIGCHTDLWAPGQGGLSDLADALGIAGKLAPVRRSDAILGPLLPGVARAAGLPEGTPVACGIHDSNASLLPHLLAQEGPFSVVSTGTWVVAMSVGGPDVALDPDRDTLINVNAFGDPVPSARFMGGREFEIIQNGHPSAASARDAAQVLEGGLMLLPAVDPGTGPYRGRAMRWHGAEPPEGSGLRSAALSYYLALMTGICLRLTGAAGPVIVEGPFARNADYLAMLRAATGRPVLRSRSATGTSIGAALLFGASGPAAAQDAVPEPENARQLAAYARAWQALADT